MYHIMGNWHGIIIVSMYFTFCWLFTNFLASLSFNAHLENQLFMTTKKFETLQQPHMDYIRNIIGNS